MVGGEEEREFRFRGDLYSQESTFPLVISAAPGCTKDVTAPEHAVLMGIQLVGSEEIVCWVELLISKQIESPPVHQRFIQGGSQIFL